MRRGEVGMDRDGGRDLPFALFDLAALQKQQTEQMRGVEMPGVAAQHALIDALRLYKLALLMERSGAIEFGLQGRVAWRRAKAAGGEAFGWAAVGHRVSGSPYLHRRRVATRDE